ncbi:MAG: hypothetical protein HYR96_00585 [Deltaproteobacteria bacterium]|nr:hypothetical protein [Deltaproteobacteria bacterium]MBI3294007.1 hypothetical protein [Deltaproteobacteria bacterium]
MNTILKGVLILITGLMVGCASMQPSAEPFATRLFAGTYDDVWLATLKALNDYPLKLSNKDAGKIHSEMVNGPYNEMLFSHPEPIQLPERFRYSMKFSFGRLETSDNKNMVRIRVVKELEKFQDFYTGWTPYPSDGLEERLLLYRIDHILSMERALAQGP